MLASGGPNLACQRGKQHQTFFKIPRQMSTLSGALHILQRKQVVLDTCTPEAERVGLSLTFSSHMARNREKQTPQCVAGPSHNANFD